MPAANERSAAPVVEERVGIAAGALRLEGVLAYREDRAPSRGALLLPPHPHFAGDLDNNVVRALAANLAAAGFAVGRFNYRGVGESEIELAGEETVYDYWERVEGAKLYQPIVDDAAAALAWLARAAGIGGDACFLVGYSFGAIVGALLVCRPVDVAGLVAIAPPLRRYPFDFLAGARVGKAFFLSTRDFLYGEAEIAALAAALEPETVIEMVRAEDHFFRGAEGRLAERVRTHLEEASR